MSVLLGKLNQFEGEEVVVVMQDNRAFRGTLVEFDADTIVLRNVVEGLPGSAGQWEEPTVSTGIVNKVVTWHGVFSHDDNKPEIVRLKDVLIQVSGVLRIWEFSTKNTMKPEHTRAASEDDANPRPASRVTRRA